MKNKNLELFLTFLKIGVITFGGGYAMISNIKEEIVDKKQWISNDELLEITAISESTPGPIAINMATYIGYKKSKFLGSLLATLGVIIPSFVIILIISMVLDFFIGNQYVQYFFIGIKAAVTFLIIKAGIKLFKQSKFCFWQYVITFSVFALMILFDIFSISFSSIILILLGGLIGFLVLFAFKKRKEEKK